MHIHILGICGTFMGSLAILAKQLGFEVSGSDANVYPPMSTQLEQQGIHLCEGFDPKRLRPAPDLVIIGNAMSRGNPSVEYVLDRGIRYTSGPEWLAQNVLHGRWVFGVAGTHGDNYKCHARVDTRIRRNETGLLNWRRNEQLTSLGESRRLHFLRG